MIRTLALLLPLALGCSAQRVSDPEPSAPPIAEAPMLTETARVELVTGRLLPIPGFDGTVTLVDGSSDFIVEPNGRTSHVTTGTLRLTHGDQASEVEFTSGRPFQHFGHTMAVYGEGGSLELGVFPPGVPASP